LEAAILYTMLQFLYLVSPEKPTSTPKILKEFHIVFIQHIF